MTATVDALRIWGPLGPWRDHTWWARSVRWSCGRPGYTPLFDWDEAYRDAVALGRMRGYTQAQILRADGDGFVEIVSAT